jgi:hypothetical protein
MLKKVKALNPMLLLPSMIYFEVRFFFLLCGLLWGRAGFVLLGFMLVNAAAFGLDSL